VTALADGSAGSLAGRHVVVTAGPTFEDLDPVRFIGNRSSGRMGFAVAAAAAEAGARVSLIAGPVGLPTPPGVERTDVRSAVEMRDAVLERVRGADLFFGVAAVSDYRPRQTAGQKLKKGPSLQQLELVSNPDIIAEVAALEDGPLAIGFAAETERLEEHAREKLSAKRLDMIAANRVGQEGSGFESEQNEIVLMWPGGETPLGKGSKRHLARLLISAAADLLREGETIETGSDQDTRFASGH
jgi:phosphopantothenoylcysteine decarboxylase/phosphopantothenate--cysteine ligase